MKIAIPCAQGQLCAHFGHCEQFAFLEASPEEKSILSTVMETPPPHEPGLLPRWLGEKGVNLILAGGMGARAQQLFAAQNIQVVTGAAAGTPETVVLAYLNGTLETGDNLCDH